MTQPATASFSLKPPMFETFVCSMAMMAFVEWRDPLKRWSLGKSTLPGTCCA